MTEHEFIVWLRGHMMEANYGDKFNWEIVNKLMQVQSHGKQLEIPFPDFENPRLPNISWTSDSTLDNINASITS
jgi:hypothetical protein